LVWVTIQKQNEMKRFNFYSSETKKRLIRVKIFGGQNKKEVRLKISETNKLALTFSAQVFILKALELKTILYW
jgi:hypothetical protein